MPNSPYYVLKMIIKINIFLHYKNICYRLSLESPPWREKNILSSLMGNEEEILFINTFNPEFLKSTLLSSYLDTPIAVKRVAAVNQNENSKHCKT